ncbi:MAG: acetate--CoA ligase family protein [Thermodesulfobacteriota bacterium]|jgi:acetyl-CoA synthetase (ADP-forming)
MEIGDILLKARTEGRNSLLYTEAQKLLDIWGIPVVQSKLASDKNGAIQSARTIGFPVVMKILSPDMVHKSDAGGVIIDLRTEEEVARAFDQMMENFGKMKSMIKIEGLVIEKMLSGFEVIIGTTKDPQFGHVLMFGMGGVFVELLKDTSFRLVPIELIDAEEMIRELKGYSLLEGCRGKRGNIDSLRDLLFKVSNLIFHYPEITEMDLNPVMISLSGSIVVDARITTGG